MKSYNPELIFTGAVTGAGLGIGLAIGAPVTGAYLGATIAAIAGFSAVVRSRGNYGLTSLATGVLIMAAINFFSPQDSIYSSLTNQSSSSLTNG